jgi:hypothetical protein
MLLGADDAVDEPQLIKPELRNSLILMSLTHWHTETIILDSDTDEAYIFTQCIPFLPLSPSFSPLV